jgi:hypothetical protein
MTGAFTVATGFATDPAMLVHRRMLLALLRASTARTAASLQQLCKHVRVAAGSSRRERARGHADVGTIEVKTNALPQLLNARLGEARIRATRTHLSAGIALLDAANEP